MKLHNRLASVQKLMATLKDAQVLERKAFSLDECAVGEQRSLSDVERATRLLALLAQAAK